ncbi:MAG: DUF6421 family protein, partial [Microterricola sp.]
MSNYIAQALVGEPEVVEDVTSTDAATTVTAESIALAADVENSPAWARLKQAAVALQAVQAQDGSVPEAAEHAASAENVATIVAAVRELAPLFPHDAAYLGALVTDFERWSAGGFGVPDFFDSLMAFQPQQHRVDGLRHLVVFPMYTQNGSSNRYVE